jgi:putative hydrolase of the HAD superfamily
MAARGTKITAVTLDVDGTLYSIRLMVLRHPLRMLGLADFFRDLHAVRDQLRGREPVEDFERLQASMFARRRGLGEEQARQLIKTVTEESWPALFRGFRPWRGLKEALLRLSSRGLKVGLISDYPVEAKIRALGLGDFPFACRVVTAEVGALKPHPAAFLKAAKILEVEPEGILHIGDREEYDIEGAQRAGMHTALFCPGRIAEESRAELVFRRWNLLEGELEKLGWLP